jgi:RNA polymerase sigma factor (sigma-70 family)
MRTPSLRKTATKDDQGDSLDAYYNQLSTVTILDKDLEFRYMQEYCSVNTPEDRKTTIREKVAESNLKLVFSLAKYLWKDKDKETLQELISAGNEGLLMAMDRYDPKYNVRFCTYAGHWVLMCMRKVQKSPVRHPTDKAPPKIFGEEAIPITAYEVNLYEVLEEDDDMQSLKTFSRFLTEREIYILNYSHGLLDHGQVKSLKDIGKKLKLSSERVRQLKTEAVKKLKTWVSKYSNPD